MNLEIVLITTKKLLNGDQNIPGPNIPNLHIFHQIYKQKRSKNKKIKGIIRYEILG